MGDGVRMALGNRVSELVPPNSADWKHALWLFIEYADEDTLEMVVQELEAEMSADGALEQEVAAPERAELSIDLLDTVLHLLETPGDFQPDERTQVVADFAEKVRKLRHVLHGAKAESNDANE